MISNEFSAQVEAVNDWYALTSQFLAIDFRSMSDQDLHGSGTKINKGGTGTGIMLQRTATVATPLDINLFILLDAMEKFYGGRFRRSRLLNLVP